MAYTQENLEYLQCFQKNNFINIFGKDLASIGRINQYLKLRYEFIGMGYTISFLLIIASFTALDVSVLMSITTITLAFIVGVGILVYTRKSNNAKFLRDLYNNYKLTLDDRTFKILDEMCNEYGKSLMSNAITPSKLQTLIQIYEKNYECIEQMDKAL